MYLEKERKTNCGACFIYIQTQQQEAQFSVLDVEFEELSKRLRTAREDEENLSHVLDSINIELNMLRKTNSGNSDNSEDFSIKTQVLKEVYAEDYLLTAAKSSITQTVGILRYEDLSHSRSPLMSIPLDVPHELSQSPQVFRGSDPSVEQRKSNKKLSPSSVLASVDESEMEVVNRGIADVSNRIRERLHQPVRDFF
jgi:hypothetical protein